MSRHCLLQKFAVVIFISYAQDVCAIQQQIDDTKGRTGLGPNPVGNVVSTPPVPQSSTLPPTSTTKIPVLPVHWTSKPTLKITTTDKPIPSSTTGDLSNLTVEARVVDLPEKEPTPHLDILAYNKLATNNKDAFGFGYGHDCNIYGSEIKQKQETADRFKVEGGVTKFTRKENDNDFLSKLCKLSRRLECIPDTAASKETTPAPAPPAPGAPPAPAKDTELRNPAGTCRCIRALSDKAIYMGPDKENKKHRPGCYIPAGFSHSSKCGHLVPLPYGIIQTVGKNTRLKSKEIPVVHFHIGNTSLMCVPGAECRISWDYAYPRCICKKDTTWAPQNGTCKKVYNREDNENNGLRALPLSASLVIISSYLIHLCFRPRISSEVMH